MRTVLYDLGVGRVEAIPAWPEGPFKISDFPILYGAARAQIAHLVGYADTIATLRGLDPKDRQLLKDWAGEFFMIDAYRKPVAWTPRAAMAANEVCFGHVTVRLHGENFRVEMARIKATEAYAIGARELLHEIANRPGC